MVFITPLDHTIQYICNGLTHSTWFARARADEECSQILPKSIQVPFPWCPARSLRGHPKSAAIGQGPFRTRHVAKRNYRSIAGVTASWVELSAAAGADRRHSFWCCFAAGAWCTSFQGQPARSKHDLLRGLLVCFWCSSHTQDTTPSELCWSHLSFFFFAGVNRILNTEDALLLVLDENTSWDSLHVASMICFGVCQYDIPHTHTWYVTQWTLLISSLLLLLRRYESHTERRKMHAHTHTWYVTRWTLLIASLFFLLCRYESHTKRRKHTHTDTHTSLVSLLYWCKSANLSQNLRQSATGFS